MMRGVGLSRGGFWGFLALSFALGLIIGTALLMWQRMAFLDSTKKLEKRIATLTTQTAGAETDLAAMRETLASTETSVSVLATQNAELTAQLASATAALTAAQATIASNSAISIVDQSTNPTAVVANTPYTLTVRVRGRAQKVTVRVASGQSSIKYNKTFALSRVSTSADNIDTWQATLTAPQAGHYHYYVYVYATASTTPTVKNLTGVLGIN
jgi:hypothetical protein